MKVFLAILPGITAFLGWMAALGTQWLTARWTRRAARRTAWNDWQRNVILETASLLQQLWEKVLIIGGSNHEADQNEAIGIYGRGTLRSDMIDDRDVRLEALAGFETVLAYVQAGDLSNDAKARVRERLKGCYRVLSEAARDLGRPE